ncbi:hypothetical protein JW711_06455 [Candidatus Woesearchaeota archaeon]|nr:hypothetical protein [Candidatus Woesearchaeota archaeon]
MKKIKKKVKKEVFSAAIYDGYPAWIIVVTATTAIATYLAGGYIMFTLHFLTGWLYVAYVLIMECSLYKEACPNCCYYGKLCAFGKGKIAKLFFKKGDSKKFGTRKLTWKDLIPQMLVVLVPLLVGVALLISRGWNWLIFIAVLYPFLNWFMLNPVVYGQLACKHCKQGRKCCPALQFFSKKSKDNHKSHGKQSTI